MQNEEKQSRKEKQPSLIGAYFPFVVRFITDRFKNDQSRGISNQKSPNGS